MSRNFRKLSSALWVLLVIVIAVVLLGGVLFARVLHGYILSVQTGSMKPAFYPGDAVIAVKAPPSKLRVGDVVSYRPAAQPQVAVTHRVIAVNLKAGTLLTKGDNAPRADPPVAFAQIIGRVRVVIPYLGHFLDFTRRPAGLATFVYVPAVLVLGSEAKRLIWHYRRQRYRWPGYIALLKKRPSPTMILKGRATTIKPSVLS